MQLRHRFLNAFLREKKCQSCSALHYWPKDIFRFGILSPAPATGTSFSIVTREEWPQRMLVEHLSLPSVTEMWDVARRSKGRCRGGFYMGCVISALSEPSRTGRSTPMTVMEHISAGCSWWWKAAGCGAVCASECCILPISLCLSLLTVPGCLSQLPSLGLSAWRQPHDCIVLCAIQLPAALRSTPGQLPPKWGKCPKNKAPVRQSPGIPGAEFRGAQPGWGDGAQRMKLFRKDKTIENRWGQRCILILFCHL